jgi:hypothetical protein
VSKYLAFCLLGIRWKASLWFTIKNKHTDDCNGCGGSVRALAASAGIQFGDLQAEAYRLRDKLGADRQKAYNECIRQMARGGAVSDAEQRMLLELGKRGFAVNSDRDLEKFLAYVHGLHKRMLADRSASPIALTIFGVVANSDVPSLNKLGRRGRILAKASQHPVRNILLGIAGGAFGGLRMSGWNPIGGVVGGIVGGAIAAVESLC